MNLGLAVALVLSRKRLQNSNLVSTALKLPYCIVLRLGLIGNIKKRPACILPLFSESYIIKLNLIINLQLESCL